MAISKDFATSGSAAGDTSALPAMGAGYRAWLVRAGIHFAVAACQKRGSVSLAEVRDAAHDLELLDGFDRAGDAWLQSVVIQGPLRKVQGDLARYELLDRSFTVTDFPLHAPVPAVTCSFWEVPGRRGTPLPTDKRARK